MYIKQTFSHILINFANISCIKNLLFYVIKRACFNAAPPQICLLVGYHFSKSLFIKTVYLHICRYCIT